MIKAVKQVRQLDYQQTGTVGLVNRSGAYDSPGGRMQLKGVRLITRIYYSKVC